MNLPQVTKGYAFERAQELGALGYKVVPIAPGQKYPKGIPLWQKAATDNPEQIAQWFRNTTNGLGWAMGEQPNGTNTFAVDVDGEAGMTSLIEMLKEHGQEEFFNTACQMTGGGGMHFVFTSDVPIANSQKQLAPHIDVRGEGGQIVVGPTIHPNGSPYQWQKMPDDRVPIPAPQWLLDLILAEPDVPHETPAAAPPSLRTPPSPDDGDTPADWVRDNIEIGDMLAEAGWTYMETRGGDSYWCRPGKDPRNGHSAILHGDAPLVVWSTEVPWRSGSDNRDGSLSFSPIQVYAEIYSAGDVSAASREIRRSMPQQAPTQSPSQADGSPESEQAGVDTTNLPPEFWESRPWLESVRQAAWARILSPDAVLGALLTRYSAVIPVNYVIPPIVGYRGTFDHLSVLVGRSSAGKTAAGGVAEELLPDVYETTIVWDYPAPSGEGLIDAFFEMVDEVNPDTGNKTKVKKQTKSAVHFTIDEAMALIQQTQRSGTTIASVILSAWSGSTIGQGNASDDRKRVIRKGKARVSGLLGIQEGLGHHFLSESLVRQGLAGRLVFFAAEDPSMPALDELPEFPAPIPWDIPPTVPTMLEYPKEVVDEVRQQAHGKTTGRVTVADIDGHINLARLKVAGIFALIDGRLIVDLTDWDLATQVMSSSTAIRQRMKSLGHDAQLKAQRDAGHMAAVRVDAQTETEQRLLINRASEAIKVALADGPLKKKALKDKISSKYRKADILNTALQELVDIRAIAEGENHWHLV